MIYAGIDIGGTKCAVVLGRVKNEEFEIISKEKFDTKPISPHIIMAQFKDILLGQMKEQGISASDVCGIGVSCGGPLSSKHGIIMAPPSLPLWDNIKIVEYFESELSIKTYLQNDANAGALAEWKFGAGKNCENMIFLTFGTGFGAGLIMNSRLYAGANDLAGEIGHIRAADDGPVGFGKYGSFEGFCSGGGIARLGGIMIEKELSAGKTPELLKKCGSTDNLTAKNIAEFAGEGDALSLEIYKESGRKLGYALSMLVDLLNPDVIVIGSVFARSRNLLWPACNEVMQRECLAISYEHCKVLPSMLGESIGDIAALATATGTY